MIDIEFEGWLGDQEYKAEASVNIIPPFKGSPLLCDNDLDYYGGTIIEDIKLYDKESGKRLDTKKFNFVTWWIIEENLNRALIKGDYDV